MHTHTLTIGFILSMGLLSLSCSQKSEETPATSNNFKTISENTQKNNEIETFIENTSGEIQVVNEEEFIKHITEINNPKGFQYKGTLPCIIDFYADWCRPCHALNPLLVEVAAKYKGQIIIYKVNVDKAVLVSEAFGIRSIPTLVFFKPHSKPAKIEGAPSKEDLEKAISEILLTK